MRATRQSKLSELIRATASDVTVGSSAEGDRRRRLILESASVKGLRQIARSAGQRNRTQFFDPVEFYLALERESPLIALHALMRTARRNTLSSGLVQSYGDHTRLALLGLGQIINKQYGWFGRRSTASPNELHLFVDAARSFLLNAQHRTEIYRTLVLALAFHDFGKFAGTDFGLDAEDASVLAKPMLDILCEPNQRLLTSFLIRNHDWIQHVPSGRVPVAFIQSQLEKLTPAAQRSALPMMGIIQFVGAASLGEGRISKERMEICKPCIRGEFPPSPQNRLRSLLGGRLSLAMTARLSAKATPIDVPYASVVLHNIESIKRSEKKVTEAFQQLLDCCQRFAAARNPLTHAIFLSSGEARRYGLSGPAKVRLFTTISGVRGAYLLV